MTNLYEILNKDGVHVCWQVADTRSDALSFAIGSILRVVLDYVFVWDVKELGGSPLMLIESFLAKPFKTVVIVSEPGRETIFKG